MQPLLSDHPASGAVVDGLSVEVIRRRLCTDTVGFQMVLFPEVASTNVVLRRLAERGARPGLVILAEGQVAGRGRFGRPWFSPPGVNLYTSVLFRPAIEPHAVAVFSFIGSLAVCDAVRELGVPAAIKWPNDVVVEGRKVAGTLVTCAIDAGRVEYVILGVGVNVNVSLQELQEALGPAASLATSLREVVGHPIDRNLFAVTFLNVLEKWFNVYTGRGPEAVLAAWRERDILCGRRVEIRGERETYEGRILGVDEEGRLQIQDAAGTQHPVMGGEIRLRE